MDVDVYVSVDVDVEVDEDVGMDLNVDADADVAVDAICGRGCEMWGGYGYLFAQDKVDQMVDQFLDDEMPSGVGCKRISFTNESRMKPVFTALTESVPILQKFFMSPHPQLVCSALMLVFRLGSVKSEVTRLLQEAQLLQSPSMRKLYQEACVHAVRLQNFFNNKSNLKEKCSDVILKEVQWFMSKLHADHEDHAASGASCMPLPLPLPLPLRVRMYQWAHAVHPHLRSSLSYASVHQKSLHSRGTLGIRLPDRHV